MKLSLNRGDSGGSIPPPGIHARVAQSAEAARSSSGSRSRLSTLRSSPDRAGTDRTRWMPVRIWLAALRAAVAQGQSTATSGLIRLLKRRRRVHVGGTSEGPGTWACSGARRSTPAGLSPLRDISSLPPVPFRSYRETARRGVDRVFSEDALSMHVIGVPSDGPTHDRSWWSLSPPRRPPRRTRTDEGSPAPPPSRDGPRVHPDVIVITTITTWKAAPLLQVHTDHLKVSPC